MGQGSQPCRMALDDVGEPSEKRKAMSVKSHVPRLRLAEPGLVPAFVLQQIWQ